MGSYIIITMSDPSGERGGESTLLVLCNPISPDTTHSAYVSRALVLDVASVVDLANMEDWITTSYMTQCVTWLATWGF